MIAGSRAQSLVGSHITAAHGAGGLATQALIDVVFAPAFGDGSVALDAATVTGADRIAVSTDGYVVTPLRFPGGCIGDLAVNGTVNDLATSGATPTHLTAGFILEEGFEIDELRGIVEAMASRAAEAGVRIVAGDTKVVPRGKGDRCYITTAGIGVHHGPPIDPTSIRPGDRVLVSGPIGDHGVTVLLARGDLEIDADLVTDSAPLVTLARVLHDRLGPDLRALRDPTRGGVATALCELADLAGVAVEIDDDAVPVRPTVRGACELLGIDPLYVACEGRYVAVVAPDRAEEALSIWSSDPAAPEPTCIGTIVEDPVGLVLVRSPFGSTRVADRLVGDPLPRIC